MAELNFEAIDVFALGAGEDHVAPLGVEPWCEEGRCGEVGLEIAKDAC